MSGLSLAHSMQASQSPTGSRPRQILLAETQGRVGGRIVTSTGEGFLKGREPQQFFAGTGSGEETVVSRHYESRTGIKKPGNFGETGFLVSSERNRVSGIFSTVFVEEGVKG